MHRAFTALLAVLPYVLAQQIGTLTAETHPALTWLQCTSSSCTTQNSAVVLDANWRWTHSVNSSTNCYTGNTWDATLCPDDVTCAANCALDGANYSGTYGITTSGNALTLKFVTGSNVGSRVYLMAPGSTTKYQTFNMLNQEFTFDVDVSQLPCGLNGALYFSAMDADGGASKYPTNKAGAQYGTGYCDSQCPRDIKFINGEANVEGWTPDSNNANTGKGDMGTCCSEMDIWEANSMSAAVTPHPCTTIGQSMCTGTTCSQPNTTQGICDQAGCDFNSFRMGNTTFYGPGMTVNTNSVFTVVTQFLTSDNTTSGTLSEIRRFYVQNGNVIPNSFSTFTGLTQYNSISEDFCMAQKTFFGDTNTFDQKGGLSGMGQAFKQGMVLVLSLWDDYAVNMLWLDSDYPTNEPTTQPGIARGSCSITSGSPHQVESQSPNSQVIYSNIRVGTIGSTFGTGPGGKTTGSTGGSGNGGSGNGGTGTGTGSAPSATQTVWGQCGGIGYNGPTTCASGSTCNESSAYYSQCIPS